MTAQQSSPAHGVKGAGSIPFIGIAACYKMLIRQPFHCVGDKYIRVVIEALGGAPLLLPAIGDRYDISALVSQLDGILLPGSPSNIEPHHYKGPPSKEGTLHDAARDATTLPLIRQAIKDGLPLIAICRGMQELNVAMGGTLHQEVHNIPGYNDHREDGRQPLSEQYGPAHSVRLVKGGFLHKLIGEDEVQVNSLHGQGIDRVADDLTAEAIASDGLVECISVKNAKSFALGVQWHPEWRFETNPVSQKIFAAFGAAIAARHASRIHK